MIASNTPLLILKSMFVGLTIGGAIIAATPQSNAQGSNSSFPPQPIDRHIVETCLDDIRQERENAPAPKAVRACIGKAAEACMDSTKDGYTTIGVMACNLRENGVWDERLNKGYQELRRSMDKEGKDWLKETQLRWIAYRDYDCSVTHQIFRGGSINRIIGSACVMEKTASRSIDIDVYLGMVGN